jgi:hypothetical protein
MSENLGSHYLRMNSRKCEWAREHRPELALFKNKHVGTGKIEESEVELRTDLVSQCGFSGTWWAGKKYHGGVIRLIHIATMPQAEPVSKTFARGIATNTCDSQLDDKIRRRACSY